ncbi:MFS transporter [Chryseobacterium sp. OV279]|uniref:MFS transporter n=1 Tax=Chryseobacterium sp. OV279 TaxID=1500285 RepID=UPI0009187F02|nr:MFS transporter [Chryseobacterium sp. OV279]SHG66598.1 Arabinose efflux permease [Chryseobacterium sp. OV279]
MESTDHHASTLNKVSWQDLFSNGNGIKAITLALGVMLHATNVYLATTVMPSVIKEIGGLEYYAWNTTFFVAASVIGSVVSANRLAKLGPKKSYQMAILLFALGTLVCTAAGSMYILLLGRFIQGLGGGLLFALSYAMIRIVFIKDLWPRAMALVSGMWGIAAFSGPFVGGIFAEQGQWRMAFGVLLIFCLLIFITASVILPSKQNKHTTPPIPYLKLLMLVLAAFSVSAGSIAESTIFNVAGVLVAVFFIYILMVTENKNSGLRLLPTGSYYFSTALSKTYVVMALLTIATSIEIFVPYFAQTIQGFSPIESGYLTVLIAIGWTLASIAFSGVKEATAGKIILAGCILMFIGLAGLTGISLLSGFDTSYLHLILNCTFLFAAGAGIGMGWPHLLTRVFALAPSGQEELASASVTTVQLMATAFGTALAGLAANIGGILSPGGIQGAHQASIILYGTFSIAPFLAAVVIAAIVRKK